MIPQPMIDIAKGDGMSDRAGPRSAIDIAAELSDASDRFSESVHEIDLIADRMRGRFTENQHLYWLSKDAERMVL